MATRMQQRRGTAAQWTAANPVLAAGEVGFETDTNKFKIGNGSSNWAALSYFTNTAGLEALLNDGAPASLNTLNEIAAAINDDPAFFTSISGSIAGSITQHNNDTTNVHGITDTSVLVTQTQLTDAINGAEVNQSALAGTGIDWNGTTDQFDIDSTVATKTYADNAVGTHNSDTTSIHGIADTAALATTTDVNNAKSDAETSASGYVSTHNSITLNVHGIADTAALALTADVNSALALKQDKVTDVSDTEIGYLNGVTSGIQAQLDAKYSSTSANTDLALKADLASPALTGTPTAPTATAGTNTTQIATTGFVTGAVADLIASAPGALNTLDELAAALGDDANFSATVTNSLAAKAPLASPTFTGTVTLPAAGIVFSDGTQEKEGVPSRTPIVQKTASYTLSALTHRDSLIEIDSTSATTLTIPLDSTINYPVGTTIDILQTNTGQVTIAPVSGSVTANATPGLKLRTRWSSATLLKRAANTWVVFGDLTA